MPDYVDGHLAFRTCRVCGLEATTKEDLNLFVTCRNNGFKYNKRNYCKDCHAEAARAYRRLHSPPKRRIFEDKDGVLVKECTKCHAIKPITEFYKQASRPCGIRSECKACCAKSARERRQRIRARKEETFLKVSPNLKCGWCGIDDPRVLVIDHINNDGAQERKIMRRLTQWKMIRKELSVEEVRERYQLLCRNCNWIRHIERLERETYV